MSLTCQRCLNKKIKNPGPCVPNPTLQVRLDDCGLHIYLYSMFLVARRGSSNSAVVECLGHLTLKAQTSRVLTLWEMLTALAKRHLLITPPMTKLFLQSLRLNQRWSQLLHHRSMRRWRTACSCPTRSILLLLFLGHHLLPL